MTEPSGATPPRTFRLSDEAMAVLDDATKTFGGATRSDTLRRILEALAGSPAGQSSLPSASALAALVGPLPKGAEEAGRKAIEQIRVAGHANPSEPVVQSAQRQLLAAVSATLPAVLQAQRRQVVDEVLGVLRRHQLDGEIIEEITALRTVRQ